MKANVENRKKVIRQVMKTPSMSLNEMSRTLNIPKASVQKYIREYRESDNKDPRILSVTNKDLEIVQKGQEIIEAKLNDPEQVAKMKASEVSAVTSESVKRYTLLRGVQNNEQSNTQNQAIQVNILFGNNDEWVKEQSV